MKIITEEKGEEPSQKDWTARACIANLQSLLFFSPRVLWYTPSSSSGRRNAKIRFWRRYVDAVEIINAHCLYLGVDGNSAFKILRRRKLWRRKKWITNTRATPKPTPSSLKLRNNTDAKNIKNLGWKLQEIHSVYYNCNWLVARIINLY